MILNSQQLRFRLIWIIFLCSFGVIFFFSIHYYSSSFIKQSALAQKSIEQLIIIIRQQAQTATYLDNYHLAKEVVQGLSKNDLIKGVKLTSKTGMIEKSSLFPEKYSHSSDNFISFNLNSPLDNRIVGQLVIYVDKDHIKNKSYNEAFNSLVNMIIHTIIISVLLFIIITIEFTSPLKKIADKLHNITPGSKDRIKLPLKHKSNEIGILANDINNLLYSTQKNMESERELHDKTAKMEKQFRLLFEEASAGIILIDLNNHITTSNQAFKDLIQSAYPDKSSLEIDQFIHWSSASDNIISHLDGLRQSKTYKTISLDFQLQADSPETKLVHGLFSKINTDSRDNNDVFIEGIIYDITKRAYREKRIRFEADHDSLTGLYNRRAGTLKMQKSILKAKQLMTKYVILMLDLDNFKPINDNYGHEAGDEILKEIAHRLKRVFRDDDLVIRWGGDEFIIGLPLAENIESIRVFAEKIIQQIEQPFVLSKFNTKCTVGISIGIAYYPNNGNTLIQLITSADTAMYAVKDTGKNNFQFFSEIS